jgi:hypothetical protein
MAFADLPFEHDLTVGTVLEDSQAWERRLAAFSQIGDDLLEHYIQAVGGFSLAHARPPGQLPGDFRLSHYGRQNSRHASPVGSGGTVPFP